MKLDKRAAFVGIGFEIIALLIVGVWLGGWLDKKFQLNGMGTAGLVILAMVLWFIQLLQMLKNLQNDRDQNPPT